MDFVRLDRADTVVTATRSLPSGSEIERIAIRSEIPSGHKVATQAMAAGDPVRKYALSCCLETLMMTSVSSNKEFWK